MEKGQRPPPEIPAPPYPGPPLDNVGVYQAQPDVQAQYGIQPLPGFQPSYPVQQVAYQYSVQQPQIIHPVNQVIVVQQLPSDVPGQMVCPHCHNTVVTKMRYKEGLLTWMICGILALFACWLCCFIPFCVDECKDVEHSCPCCNQVLHIYKRM